RQLGCPVAYVNAVGGNDELLFDGRSVVCDATGNVIGGLAAFREQLQVISVSAKGAPVVHETFEQEDLADVYDALVLGVRDYAQKTGFKKALLGLSGGIDSALTAVIAAEALGPKNVIGVSLPSVISSQHSKDDARILAENLGIEYHTISIGDTVAAAEQAHSPSGTAPFTATCAVDSPSSATFSKCRCTRSRAGSIEPTKSFPLRASKNRQVPSFAPTKPIRTVCP